MTISISKDDLMGSPLSMTTRKRPHKSGRMVWLLRKTPSGEMRFIPVEEKQPASPKGGTVHATMTSRMVHEGKVQSIVDEVVSAGGSAVSLRGRTMKVEVDGEDVEAVGDVLESFGCQWDIS